MSAPLTPRIFAIPLEDHEAIVAALHLCAMIGNDNHAVVMLKGYNDDFDEFTGVYLSDYETEDLDDPDWFADYADPQLWVTVLEGGAS